MAIPSVRIKIEPEEEEDTVPCDLCEKTFCNTVALRNHWSIYHAEHELITFQNECTIPSTPETGVIKTQTEKESEFLNSLRPVNLASLASEDVSYIIIKSEDAEELQQTRKRTSDGVRKPYSKRERVSVPLKGPFECLQPSNLVGDAICHQIFFSCCDYSAHYRDEHTKRRKGQRCQVCEKPLQGAIIEHMYTCQVCSVGFNSNKELNLHIDTEHEQLRPFQCIQCKKRFSQHGGLVQHMRMHTGERPFACQLCPKAFTQKSGLDQHIRIHTKAKPYRCVVCGKTFCQSIHMKQHMRVHTNVSPFQCALCQKRFKQSSHLKYHLKAHDKSELSEEDRAKLAHMLAMSAEDDEDGGELIVSDMVVVGHDEGIQQDSGMWNSVTE